jgi:hypothetical protein
VLLSMGQYMPKSWLVQVITVIDFKTISIIFTS